MKVFKFSFKSDGRRLLVAILLSILVLGQAAHGCEKVPGRDVVDALLSLDLAAAQGALDAWRSRDPADPMLDFYAALKTLSVGYIESGHDQEFRKKLGGDALKQLARIVKQTESAVEAGNATVHQQLAYGMAQAFGSVLHALREEMVKSYELGYKGRKVLDEVVAANPDLHDPYLILGLFEYHVGVLPDNMKWKAKLLGLQGDPEMGVAYLERAIASAPATAPEAARTLLMDLELPEEEQCRYRSLAKQMRDLYPSNVLFPVFARVYEMQCRIAEKEGRAVAEDQAFTLASGCK